jgi:ribosomal subunit interface protein
MQIHISAQHFSLGESLQSYIHDKLSSHIKKFLDHTVSCDVHFDKVHHSFMCEIVVHTGIKATIVSNSASEDAYSSFDIGIVKLDKQLRKYKSKLKDYHHKMKMAESIETKKYIIDPNIEEDQDNDPKSHVIIAEKPVEIMSLTIKEAVMRMDLENLPALMFTNLDSRRLNVVYYRKDGNIAWVDSK